MKSIHYKNMYLHDNGLDMECVLCSKRISYDYCISFQGINCICDECRDKLSDIFQISPADVMEKAQNGAKMIVNNDPNLSEIFDKKGIRYNLEE